MGTIGAPSTFTGTAGSTVVLRRDASRSFTGTFTGSLGLLSGSTVAANVWTLTQNNTYTGPTLINGGTVSLVNAGAFSQTSALTINRGGLTLDNTASMDVAVRIPTALPISLGGGTLSYVGKVQFNSAETLGAVSALDSANTINVTQQTTGVSSATLTLASLVRSTGATVNFTNTGGTLGSMGSNPQIVLTAAPTVTNSLLGGGYVVNGTDFASYIPTLGVGGLSSIGYAGYSPNLVGAGVNDNVSIPGNLGINLDDTSINALRVTGTAALTFNAGKTLTLASGGLLANANLTLGNAVNNGTLTTTGSELFLYVNSGTTIINSAITGTGVALVKSERARRSRSRAPTRTQAAPMSTRGR